MCRSLVVTIVRARSSTIRWRKRPHRWKFLRGLQGTARLEVRPRGPSVDDTCGKRRGGSICALRCCRKLYPERRAFPGRTLESDAPVHALDHLAGAVDPH